MEEVSAVRDPIALVEACYDLQASDEEWLATIARHARPLLKVEEVLAYHIDLHGSEVRFGPPVCTTPGSLALERIRGMGQLLERSYSGKANALGRLRARLYERVVRTGISQPADRMLLSELDLYGPRWMYTLGVPRVSELVHLGSRHIDGNGVTLLVGPRAKADPLHPAERTTYQMVSAHVKAGLRLRRRLADRARATDAPAGGAVLDSAHRVVHAEGDARADEVRAAFAQRAKEIDRARTRAAGRNDEALAVWQGLIDGRWSLVERFDVDGKRYLLAHENPEGVVDPRGLGALEARVVGLAARGYSDKLVAYHLGLSTGTVASCISRAMRKLRVGSRSELLRMMGTMGEGSQ